MGYKVFIFKLFSRLPQVPCTHDSLVCIMGSHLLCLSFMVVVVGLYEPCLSFKDLSENKMVRPSSHLHCSMGLDCDVAKLIHCILFGELFASICEFRVWNTMSDSSWLGLRLGRGNFLFWFMYHGISTCVEIKFVLRSKYFNTTVAENSIDCIHCAYCNNVEPLHHKTHWYYCCCVILWHPCCHLKSHKPFKFQR